MNQNAAPTNPFGVPAWVWALRWPLAFALVIVLALAVRLQLVDRGHEDEVHTIGRSLHIIYSGEFAPGFYKYPSGPMYLTLLADMIALGSISRETSNGGFEDGGTTPLFRLQQNYQVIIDNWVFREASDPVLDALLQRIRTVFLVFIPAQILLLAYIGWRLNLLGPAWIAALFLACSPASAIESSYVAVNTPAGFFVLLAVAVMVFLGTRCLPASVWGLWGQVAGIAFVCGLAVSCKYNAGVALLLPILYAALMLPRMSVPHPFETGLMAVVVSVFALAVGFTVLTPFWIWEFELFARDVLYEVWHNQTGHAPWNTFEPGLQMTWYNTLAITDQVSWPGLLVFLASLGFLGWRQARSGSRLSTQHLLLLPMLVVCIAFFIVMSRQAVFFARNFSIIWPVLFFCMAASGWLALDELKRMWAWTWLDRFKAPLGIGFAVLCVFVALVLDPLVVPREWWREWWRV